MSGFIDAEVMSLWIRTLDCNWFSYVTFL